MKSLPPLNCLRFFEAAARHQSFARAADELGVTAAAVAHRIRLLENYLRAELFVRRGRAYFKEVRRILLDIHHTTEFHADRRRFRSP